ncbi:MAG: ribbon-helix-helix domain-containing protein [Patescibacteria group bacterium]
MNTKIVNLSLPKKLLDMVDEAAKAEYRTRSELVREALRQYVGKEKFSKLTASLGEFAAQQGFKPEDVNRLIKEYRAKKVGR